MNWHGRLDETVFLNRLIDLSTLPSTDGRFDDARGDIWQHRINNSDWDDDWVYDYAPLGLFTIGNDLFLKFLTDLLHPVVRPDSGESRALAQELNDLLRPDGIELYEANSIGQRPTWAARRIGDRGPTPLVDEATAALESAAERIWGRGALRLFLSHSSAHKIPMAGLKRALAVFGIAAFVAHEDIEPTREWEVEIRRALTTMDAFVPVVTPDFHGRVWTDQEIGVALGRNAYILAIRAPTAPSGFLARHQAMSGDLTKPAEVAARVVETMLRQPTLFPAMREALTLALEQSASYADTKAVAGMIIKLDGFDDDQIARLRRAIDINDQVGEYMGVGRLRSYLEARSPSQSGDMPVQSSARARGAS